VIVRIAPLKNLPVGFQPWFSMQPAVLSLCCFIPFKEPNLGCIPGLTICSCNPWPSCSAFYGRTFRLSFWSRLSAGLSGTKCPSGSGAHFPKDLAPVSVDIGPESSVYLKPCDSVVERTFPVFFDLLSIVDWSGTSFT
jgi:hypothetical protein